MATIIAALSGLAILAVIAIAIYSLYPRGAGSPAPSNATVDDLAHAYFLTEIASARFDSSLPPNWNLVGGLPLAVSKGGLRPMPKATPPTTSVPSSNPADATVGGAIVAPSPIAASEPFEADAVLKLGKPSDDLLVQFFVSTDPQFSADRATSSNELVWLLQGASQRVLTDGQEQASLPRPMPADRDGAGAAHEGGTLVRILVNREVAVVEANGQRIWSGRHGLAESPRYVGVRFLRVGQKGADPAVVQSITLLKK